MEKTVDYTARNIEAARYNDLTAFVAKVYQDGIVSQQEMKDMNAIKADVLYEYQIVSDLLAKTDRNSPAYARMEALSVRLRRGWQLMSWATDKGAAFNEMNARQKLRLNERSRVKTKLDMKDLTASEMLLLVSAMSPEAKKRLEIDALNKQAENAPLSALSQDKRRAYETKVANTLSAMQKQDLNEIQIYHMLGLERSR